MDRDRAADPNTVANVSDDTARRITQSSMTTSRATRRSTACPSGSPLLARVPTRRRGRVAPQTARAVAPRAASRFRSRRGSGSGVQSVRQRSWRPAGAIIRLLHASARGERAIVARNGEHGKRDRAPTRTPVLVRDADREAILDHVGAMRSHVRGRVSNKTIGSGTCPSSSPQ